MIDYPNYGRMVADAQRFPALWRLLAGCLTAAGLAFVWVLSALTIAVWWAGDPSVLFAGRELAPADTPGKALIFLTLIFGLGIGAWGAARVWHKRSFRSLIGPGPRVLRHFILAAGLTYGAAAIVFLITWPVADPIEPNMAFGVWVLWLPLAVVAIVLQTGAEEVLFRGYLQSQLAARFRSPAIWILLPSLLFGVAHFGPGLPLNAALGYVIFAFMFGVIAADLTARSGTLGAAWGFHFANNSIAILFLTTQGSLSGLGLFRSGDIVGSLSLSPLVLLELVALVLVWLAVRRFVTA